MADEYELNRTASPTRRDATDAPTMPADGLDDDDGRAAALHRRTLRKLDFLLLPFLALLFLFNSLDKSNVRPTAPLLPESFLHGIR